VRCSFAPLLPDYNPPLSTRTIAAPICHSFLQNLPYMDFDSEYLILIDSFLRCKWNNGFCLYYILCPNIKLRTFDQCHKRIIFIFISCCVYIFIQGFCTVTQHVIVGFHIISDNIEYTNESICLLYQVTNTTCFDLSWSSSGVYL
jgi:hypothetical protein